jgi:hypothetical protein
MKIILIMLIATYSLIASDVNIKGTVYVNGKKATKNMKVNLNDFIVTKENSKVTFTIGENAFMAKENTTLLFSDRNNLKTLKVLKGGVLAVFKTGDKFSLKTKNMTAGIRGTGVYLENIKDKSYYCTCYGDVDIKSETQQQNVKASHHNIVWVSKDGNMTSGKMINHTDKELRELEALVGRVPAFDKDKI